MQSAFFKLTQIFDYDKVKAMLKKAIDKSYGKKGQAVVEMNYRAVDSADSNLIKFPVPPEWATLQTDTTAITTDQMGIIKAINGLKGDRLPVSAFNPDGHTETATTQYEKRNIATQLPQWIPENCIQCNRCAFVCPHACIRPCLTDGETLKKAPQSFKTIKALGIPAQTTNFSANGDTQSPCPTNNSTAYRIQVSPKDCTGCGSCANVCPAKNKALQMVAFDKIDEDKNYEFSLTVPYPDFAPTNVKMSQFRRPLFEFSGACGGCGETPYIKLLTQLYGERLIIANATGCSSIYGGSSPTCPYAKNSKGQGVAWANSLFEDNAEFGFGIKKALNIREGDRSSPKYCAANDGRKDHCAVSCKQDEKNKATPQGMGFSPHDQGGDRSSPKYCAVNDGTVVWCVGGDGWAYDIGFGGLDHILSTDEDINVLVLDTEVYSNTGGQASKATPKGATAKFASGGKPTGKKDLGAMMMQYPNCYVAQVAMGANYEHTLKVLKEATEHKGPSLVIAFSTCINHGIDMSNGMKIMADAVKCGYTKLYHRNPKDGGEIVIDSPEPTESIDDFKSKQTRFRNAKC
jgi:pyruvate-ferredoxin/flavodoxin oxidoreductase